MTGDQERDELMSALADLPRANPDPIRAEALIARATRTMARRRVSAERRIAMLASFYRIAEPVAACLLSAAFLAAVFGQAIFIIANAHASFLWR